MAKPNPDKVNAQIGKIAIQRAEGDRQKGWSEYIRAMYQNTGSLAPRCDAKDFYAWFDEQNKAKPDIVIVIEGGNVIGIATAGQGITVRVIDLDQKKVGEKAINDYAPDGENVNLEQYTKDMMED